MQILMVGRPPRRHWRLPSDAHIVVCGTDVSRADWYEAVPVPDPADLEQLLFGLRHVDDGVPMRFDSVYCDYEHAMVNAAIVGALCGARQALSPDLALLGRDKLSQKWLVAAAGVPTARVELAPMAAAGFDGYRPALPTPLVVKPALGSAGRAVSHADDPASAAGRAARIACREPALVETFVAGPECHIDAVITRERPVLLSVGFYLSNVIDTDYLRPTGSCIEPYEGNEDLYRRAEEMITACRAAFGLVEGVMHLEAFDTPEGLIFSECAFRRAGGKSSETVALATATDYRQMSCLAALGLLQDMPLVRPHRSAAWVMVRTAEGRLLAMPDNEDFASIPGLEEVVMRRDAVGSDIGPMTGAYDRLGHVIVTGADSAATRAAVQKAARIFHDAVAVRCPTGVGRGAAR